MSTSGVRGKGVPSLWVSLQMVRPVTKNRSILDNAVDTWRLIGSPGYPQTDQEVRERLIAEFQRSSYSDGYMRQIAAIYNAPNRIELLKSIKVPVLIIHGKEDILVPVNGGEDTASHISQAKLVVFEGMGHTLPQPLLKTFVELMLENNLSLAL
jgi:pimeloyl-ACP methyl ester carboxylesterase